MITFHLERGLCSTCSDLPVRKSTPLCVSVGCLPDISSCSKQNLPFSFLCITGEMSHSVSADALPLATVCRSLVFSSPDSFPRSLVLHPSLDHGHIPSGMAVPAPGSNGETSSEVNFRLHPFRWRNSAWGSVPYFLYKSKGTCGLNLSFVHPSYLSSSICAESTRNASESTPHKQMVFPSLCLWGTGFSLYKILWSFIWSLSRKQKPELDSWAQKSLFLKDLALLFFFFTWPLS